MLIMLEGSPSLPISKHAKHAEFHWLWYHSQGLHQLRVGIWPQETIAYCYHDATARNGYWSQILGMQLHATAWCQGALCKKKLCFAARAHLKWYWIMYLFWDMFLFHPISTLLGKAVADLLSCSFWFPGTPFLCCFNQLCFVSSSMTALINLPANG